MQSLGVIDEEARLLAITLGKVICGDLKGLVYTFTDGNGRHHDDELAPAIAFVHLENCLDVAVGFASTGLHLHVQMDACRCQSILFVGRLDGPPVTLFVVGSEFGQRLSNRQVLPTLNSLDILQYLSFADGQVSVLEAFVIKGAGLRTLAWVNPVSEAIMHGLMDETVHHGIHGMGLVGLGFKLQLHGNPFCSLSAFLSAMYVYLWLAERSKRLFSKYLSNLSVAFSFCKLPNWMPSGA